MKLAISIVIYSPDIELLTQVVGALKIACRKLNLYNQCVSVVDIVDNNLSDGRKSQIRAVAELSSGDDFTVEVINSKNNLGYGGGNNLSIWRHSVADYHLVLNPDVIVQSQSLVNAVRYMQQNEHVGLLSPKVLGFDNVQQYLCKRNPMLFDMVIRSFSIPLVKWLFKRRIADYEMRDRNYESTFYPVPYPTGCFMLFRRSVLTKIDGFDEGFFLHYEDADIGRRVGQISLTAYVPDVIVYHKWSRESHKSLKMKLITIKSGVRYWWKWGGVW